MRILFLSRWYPYPLDNGSRIRVFNLLKILSVQHEVDLLSFVEREISQTQLDAMAAYCRHIAVAIYIPFQPDRIHALKGLFSVQPRSAKATYSLEMQTLVDALTRARRYDVVIASQVDMIPYTPQGIPAILEELEFATLVEQYTKATSLPRKVRHGLTLSKLRRYLQACLPRFAACTVVAQHELDHVRRAVPSYGGRLAVVPNGVDRAYYTGDFGSLRPDTLIYAGAVTYQANYDAVDYFVRVILPLIQEQRPQVQLFVTGGTGDVAVEHLRCRPGVHFTGYVDDLRPLVAQSWVAVVPLRRGGGTRLKILEALALGTPVVATSKGAEGLDLVPGQDILIGDQPRTFADNVLQMLGDPDQRARLQAAGHSAIARYDWRAIGEHFCHLVEGVAEDTDIRR